MTTMQKNQQGFTLVELIIVIVILGILAVTAAPRFFNFTTDARVSVLESIEGSLKATGSMIEGRAQIGAVAGNALSCYAVATDIVTAETDAAKVTANVAATEGAAPGTNCTNGVDIVFGAMDAETATFTALAELGDFAVVDALGGTTANDYLAPVAAGTVRIGESVDALKTTAADGCWVTYTEPAAAGARPVITVNDDGCN